MPTDVISFLNEFNPWLLLAAQICLLTGRAACAAMLHLPAPAVVYLAIALVHGLRARRADPRHADGDVVHCMTGLAMATAYAVTGAPP